MEAAASGWFGSVQSVDLSILMFIQEHLRFPALTPVWRLITHLGDHGLFWIILGLILLIPKKTRLIGFLGLLSTGLGFLITNVWIKNAVDRIRPYEVYPQLILLIEKQKDFSFPSGHACAAFASAGIYFRMLKKPWGLLLLILAFLISFSRPYVAVHYPSDVLCGALIGLAASLVVYQIYQKIQKRKNT